MCIFTQTQWINGLTFFQPFLANVERVIKSQIYWIIHICDWNDARVAQFKRLYKRELKCALCSSTIQFNSKFTSGISAVSLFSNSLSCQRLENIYIWIRKKIAVHWRSYDEIVSIDGKHGIWTFTFFKCIIYYCLQQSLKSNNKNAHANCMFQNHR